jgi:outer membrane protein OmpU
MRRISGLACLLATTAAAVPASAEIVLFGNARLGIGYNIDNEGEVARPASDDTSSSDNRTTTVEVLDPATGETVEEEIVTEVGSTEDLRAVSRIRWGVTMTGETESGVAFGATIRADNASSGGTGDSAATGQTAGEVFVSSSWGVLTFGDIDGADYARVGDPIGNVTLTGLGDFNELPFISNGGGSDNDELQFITQPDVRPTVRYDYDYEGFGLSLSTDRDLNSVGVGGSYAHDFSDMASVRIGAGYYDFSAFTGEIDGYGEIDVPDGKEWSLSLTGEYGDFQAGVGYASIDAGDIGQLDVLSLGAGASFDAWTVMAYYANVVSGDELFGEAYDGNDSYGASLAYDLGGGASVNMGVARSYGADAVGTPGADQYAPAFAASTVADFGISMKF